MPGLHGCKTMALPSLFVILSLVGGCPGADNPHETILVAQDDTPVIARAGGQELRLGQLDALASAAMALRKDAGLELAESALPAEQEAKLALALEVLSLAADAGSVPRDPPVREEQVKRLLARVYAKRIAEQADRQPVTPEDLQAAHEWEIALYVSARRSKLYRPTLVDSIAIAVGCFPDFHTPERDEECVLDWPSAEALAIEIHRAVSEPVVGRDQDRFKAVGRRFMQGNPTVVFKEFPKVELDPTLSSLDPILHTAITGLSGTGSVSGPIRTDGGFYIIRRGVAFPGKGETLDELRTVLETKLKRRRRREAIHQALSGLRQKYEVRTFPERLENETEGKEPNS